MKGLSILAAFLGGAVVGAAVGILFAPDKGEETRKKIIKLLKEKGINLDDKQMDDLVDRITEEVIVAKEES